MEKEIKEFNGHDGSIAFVLPFLFSPNDEKETNRCTELFNKIKQDEDRFSYHELKNELKEILSEQFPKAEVYYRGSTIIGNNEVVRKCCRSQAESLYKGRNLCSCFSVSRKFHDDPSKDIQRLEIFLGTHHIRYEIEQSDKFFEFYLDSLLLLSNEKGGECGYLVFNINIASIRENCVYKLTENYLDIIIFLKHLFYKNKLTCSIDTTRNISIQDWTNDYFNRLLVTLGVRKQSERLAEKKQKVSFEYSITELNNIVDANKKLLPLSTIMDYKKQLYGLMVSDEGWRYFPQNELEEKFKKNHWSSRTFSYAFFLDHNALIINQYEEKEKESIEAYQPFSSFSKEWFSTYAQSSESVFYYKYPQLRPCLPGIASLVFYSFLKAIYKELVLSNVKEMSNGEYFTDEEKYKKLALALQQHSMSLDAIKNIDDCIFSQFGIHDELTKLQERYTQEANNVNNKKVVNLTQVTFWTSISALIIAVLAIGIEHGSIFSAGLYGTFFILGAALFIPILAYLILLYELKEKWKKWKV